MGVGAKGRVNECYVVSETVSQLDRSRAEAVVSLSHPKSETTSSNRTITDSVSLPPISRASGDSSLEA